MVVKNFSTSAGPHFLRTCSDAVDIGPSTFWRFPVCSTDPRCPVEGEISLARGDMSSNMKLRHKEVEGRVRAIGLQLRRKGQNALPELFVPLAGNIIGKVDYGSGRKSGQGGEYNVIHVHISDGGMSTCSNGIDNITHFSPLCKSPMPFASRMSCRAQTTEPTPVAASPLESLVSAMLMAL